MDLYPSLVKQPEGESYMVMNGAKDMGTNASGCDDVEYSVDFLGDRACVVMTKNGA